MWEFSITINKEKQKIASFICSSLKDIVNEVKGIITTYEKNSLLSVIVACEETDKIKVQYQIADVISKAICVFMKEDFLDQHLKIKKRNKFESFTFKKALISFDRETDRFIINKYLCFDKNLVLESFFYFKLIPLKEKWEELVKIANDNSTYLLSDDSFIELLRFLVENIEFNIEGLKVKIKNETAEIFDLENNVICESLNLYALVEKIFEFSPQKIYWESDKKIDFLEKVFDKRIIINNDFLLKTEIINNSLQS